MPFSSSSPLYSQVSIYFSQLVDSIHHMNEEQFANSMFSLLNLLYAYEQQQQPPLPPLPPQQQQQQQQLPPPPPPLYVFFSLLLPLLRLA